MNQNTVIEKQPTTLAQDPIALLNAWTVLQKQHKGPMPLGVRDAALALGVTEVQLIASRCGDGVIRLKADWPELIMRLPQLGYIMSLVRNDSIVHERKGEYANISFEGHGGKIGVVATESIDLRIFLYRWDCAFAVVDTKSDGSPCLSLQFFDKYGTAIQKIFLTENSHVSAYEKLIQDYIDENQEPLQAVEALPAAPPTLPDEQIDVVSLRQTWAQLKDTHDFYPLLKRLQLGREQALRLGGPEWAVPVSLESALHVLETASKTQLTLMVFVGNENILQIHTGPVDNIKRIHGWLNVLDAEFNLHLKEEDVKHAWLVRKPTVDGIVTSLELYDKNEQLIVTFFGKRKPGLSEDATWRELAESLAAK